MNPLKPNLKEKERPIFTPTKTKVRDLQVRIDDSGRKEFNENERRDKEEAKEFQSPSIEMRPTGPHLDLGGQNRENLSLLKDKQHHKLTSICLNHNKLKNLDELSNLPLLTKIEAVDNCLTQVNLSFDHLIELNLSDNELTEVINGSFF